MEAGTVRGCARACKRIACTPYMPQPLRSSPCYQGRLEGGAFPLHAFKEPPLPIPPPARMGGIRASPQNQTSPTETDKKRHNPPQRDATNGAPFQTAKTEPQPKHGPPLWTYVTTCTFHVTATACIATMCQGWHACCIVLFSFLVVPDHDVRGVLSRLGGFGTGTQGASTVKTVS